MARAKSVALASARLVTGLAGVAAAVVIYGSIALVPWPSFGINPPVALVNPDANEQRLVCSGPLLATGADPSQAGIAASLGPVSVTSTGGNERALENGNPNAARDGAPVVRTGEKRGNRPPPLPWKNLVPWRRMPGPAKPNGRRSGWRPFPSSRTPRW